MDDRRGAGGHVYTLGRAGDSSLLLRDLVCMGLVAGARADVGGVVVLPGACDGGYAGLRDVTERDGRPVVLESVCNRS